MTSSSAYPAQAEAAVAIDPEAAAALSIDPEADKAAAKNCKDVHQAAKEDNVGAVRHFLRVDPDSLERKDIHFGGTPLHVAAARGHVEVVALLLRSGASVEVTDRNGQTPLHFAAWIGHAAVVEQLISAGATVDTANILGNTALHFAALEGHCAVVDQLISAGATVDAADRRGRGPGRVFELFWAWL